MSTALQAPVVSHVTDAVASKRRSAIEPGKSDNIRQRGQALHSVETGEAHGHVVERTLDADEYPQAKKELKKAVLEHYRCDILQP